MHADAELHRLICRLLRVLGCDRGLYCDRTLHGIDRAGEVSDNAVAGDIEDAATMRRDQSIDDGATCLKPGERTDLVPRHQPAVAGDVGGEDRSEFALYRLDRHAGFLPGPSIPRGATAARPFGWSHGRPVARTRSSAFRRSGSPGCRVIRVG